MPIFRLYDFPPLYDFDKVYSTHQGLNGYGGLAEPKCKNHEADFLRCAAKLGVKRAHQECLPELEDFRECITGFKRMERIKTIIKHRDQLVKKGEYTPPPKQ